MAEASEDSPPPSFSNVLRRQRSGHDAGERIAANLPQFFQMAKDLAGRQQVEIKEVWPHIAWSCDVALHLLDADPDTSKKQSIPHQFCMTAYTFVNFVQQRAHKGAEKLYLKYRELMKQYLQADVVPAIKRASGDGRIKEFIRRWENHKIFSEWIRRFFEILDRGFIADSVQASLSAVAIQEWKDTLFADVKDDFIGTILSTIQRHRETGPDDQSEAAIRSCKEIFCMMGITDHRDFKRIKYFVNHLKASKKGKFEILENMPLLDQQHNRPTADGNSELVLKVGDTKNLLLYQAEFEKPILGDTRTYCAKIRRDLLESESLPLYLQKCKQVLHEESDRVDRYLHHTTKPKLLNHVMDELLKQPQENGQLIEKAGSGFMDLLKNRRHDDIKLVFEMMSLVNDEFCGKDQFEDKVGLKPLSKIFRKFIEDEGFARIDARTKALMQAEGSEKHVRSPQDSEYVTQVLEHVAEMKAFVQRDFCVSGTGDESAGHKLFEEELKLAFEHLINWDFGKPGQDLKMNPKTGKWKVEKSGSRLKKTGVEKRTQMAELLASYMHMVLGGKVRDNAGKTIENLSVTAIHEKCDATLELFSFLMNKDIFGDCYKALLMKRLLKGDFNDNNERSVLSKLSFQQGLNYVRSMQTMFNDLMQSKKMGNLFKEHWLVKQPSMPGAKDVASLTVAVLTRAAWPPNLFPMDNCKLPDAIDDCKACFYQWYKGHNNKRELSYHWLQSTAQVEAKFPKLKFKTLRLKMTAPQAFLLSAFDKGRLRKGHSCKEIAEYMGLAWDDISNKPAKPDEAKMLKNLLRTFLRPFPDCRGALLKKKPSDKPPVKFTDTFLVNGKLESRRKFIHIREPEDWKLQFDPEKTFKARKHVQEAAIVRVMKARTKLTHAELIAEVIAQIRIFTAEPRQIKRCIESLVDREFLARDPDFLKNKFYHYKA